MSDPMTTKRTAEERAAEKAADAIKPSLFSDLTTHQIAQRRLGYMKAWVEEVEPLEEWKESAIKVMSEWDKVHEALGKPGKLGESMAAASLAEVVKLQALVQVLGNAFVRADNGSVEQDGTKQASGHAHHIHAIWDMDNGPAKAGKPCLKCLAFDAARLALKQEGFVPTNTQDNG